MWQDCKDYYESQVEQFEANYEEQHGFEALEHLKKNTDMYEKLLIAYID